MKVGITGANGFIGSLLVERNLDLGNEVHILSRKKGNVDSRVKRHIGDLLDQNSLNSFVKNIDVLYHCAAEINNEQNMKAVNVEGTANLLKAATGNIKHFIQLSSVGVYGSILEGDVTESQSYQPVNEYEKTKLAADLLVLDAVKKKEFTFTIIRPSIVFGKKMNNQSLLQLITIIDKRLFFFIGKKGASANYVPVENVVEALLLAGNHPNAKNQIYNISNWNCIEYFVGLIAEKIEKPTPKFRIPLGPVLLLAKISSFIPKNPLTVSRLSALNNRSRYSTDKIEKELQYQPVITVEKGIEQIVQVYKNKK